MLQYGMTQPTVFTFTFVLSGLRHHAESVINDYFDSALEQIEWFKNKALSRETPYPHDEAYLRSLEQTRKVLEATKMTATATERGNDLLFTFDIPNHAERFNEISQDGRRLWLRQYFEDFIGHYTRTSILDKSFDWREGNDVVVAARMGELHDALNQAMEQGNDLRSAGFWIEHEVEPSHILFSSPENH